MKKKNYRHYVLSFGHLCSDIAHGALSAILPFLIAAYHFDYTTAAMLVMVANIVASVIQPIFGHLADKIDNPRIMVYGVILAGGGMAMTGVLSNFGGLCIAVMISGIGSALFHPQAAQLVNRNADEDSIGFHLGVFSFGGNMGFTLGPIVATASIAVFGLPGTLVFFVPAAVFGVLSTKFFPKGQKDKKRSAQTTTAVGELPASCTKAPEALAEAEKTGETVQPDGRELSADGQQTGDPALSTPKYKDRWGAFAKLGILVGFRSIVYSGIGTFLVLYFVDVLGQTESTGNIFLSFYYAVSALAALFGGKLSDNFGHRKTVWLSFGILLPAIVLFTLSHNYWLCVLMLIPIGAGLNIGYSPLVLMGQRYLPNHVGFASGITLGLIVSVGGIFTPILGKIGDTYGLTATFIAVCAVCAFSFLLSLFLSDAELVEAESN